MDIKKVLSESHAHIKDMREALLQQKEQVDDLGLKVKLWELEQMTDISNEVDDKGKAVHSNESKRQAELESRKKDDFIYQEMSKVVKTQKYNYDLKVILLQSLIDQQENARALARLGS